MPTIKKLQKGQQIRALDWNALADSYNGGTFGLGTVSGGRPMPPSVVKVKNVSGADRSRFETMEVSGLVMPLENDGRVDLVFEADTVTASSETIVILLAPIEDGRIGFAVIDGPAMALVSGGSGSFAEIDAANNRLKPAASGEIKLLASPHATDTKLIPVVLNVGTGGGDSHYIFTTSTAFSSGAATATVKDITDTTTIETGATIIGTLGDFDGVTSGTKGICFVQGGAYYAIRTFEQHLTDVRWDDPDLEKTRDNAQTWDNVDTAQDCP